MLDERDRALQDSCRCLSMPLFSRLPELQAGQRMLLGRNGLYLELKNPWLDCCVNVASLPAGLTLPYGVVSSHLSFAFGRLPLDLLQEFIALARAACPLEVAGALIYTATDNAQDDEPNGCYQNGCGQNGCGQNGRRQGRGTLRLRLHESISVGCGHVRYRIAALDVGEYLAVDLHSHGRLPAFWSDQDDRDDNGVRVCGVFGRLDRPQLEARFRLVLNGHHIDLPSPWDDPNTDANPGVNMGDSMGENMGDQEGFGRRCFKG